MNSCKKLRQYIKEQLRAVGDDEHFKKHKWYRSEEAEHDIGFEAALQSFAALPQYREFVCEFRRKYCGQMCELGDKCTLWHHVCPMDKRPAHSPRPSP